MPTSKSRLYNGGGTNNALQTAATSTALAALGTAPVDISTFEDHVAIRVFLMNTTAAQGCTLSIGVYDGAGNYRETIEKVISSDDHTFDTKQDVWGLAAGTDKPAKNPQIISFQRPDGGCVLKMWVSASDGGVWYARYQLLTKTDVIALAAAESASTGGGDSVIDPIAKGFTKVVKAVTTASTAEKLVASTTYARYVELQAKKVAADNTGNVFIGLSDLDQGTAELFELEPGDSIRIDAPDGIKFDISTIYVDADTSADGVVGWYLAV